MGNAIQAALKAGQAAAKKNQENKKQVEEVEDLQLLPLDIDKIHFDPGQPRSEWELDKLEELAASIEETGGCHTPIKVKPHPTLLGEFMLVYGEGRLRSHKLKNIQVIMALLDTKNTENDFADFFVQVTENISRNPMKKIDEARAYHRLMVMHKPKKLTQLELSKKIGKNRTYIGRVLKLLDAPSEVQELSVLNVTQNLNLLAYLSQLSNIVTNAELLSLIDEVRTGDLGEKALQRHLSELQNPTPPEEEQASTTEHHDKNQMIIDGIDSGLSDYAADIDMNSGGDNGQCQYDYSCPYQKALFDSLIPHGVAFELTDEQKDEAVEKLQTVVSEWVSGEYDGVNHKEKDLLHKFVKGMEAVKEPIRTVLNIRWIRALFTDVMKNASKTDNNNVNPQRNDETSYSVIDEYEVFDDFVLLTVSGQKKQIKVSKTDLQDMLGG